MDRRDVLLLTQSKDFYTVDQVMRSLSRKGYRPFRFNMDLFPGQIQLSIRLKDKEMHLSLEDNSSGTVIRAEDIRAVWLRKIGTPHIEPGMESLLRQGCLKESRETLNIFLNQLETVPWIDRLSVVRRAEDKLYQLRTAREAGLPIPRTLITNNPLQVRDFFKEVKGNMVAKMLTPLTTSMKGDTPFVYTNLIGPDDLADLHMLEHSPMVFQEFIPKEVELRIAYVNGGLFTGAVRSGEASGDHHVDWRVPGYEDFKWELFDVPEEWTHKIDTMMKKLGLYFGVLDVIVSPDGSYTFLEVGPTGEWGMLERDLGLPISTAIADTLINLIAMTKS
ncbi:MAG: MvdC family ATP-grasp ribosomal peptide maturase [bacterium]|nr:MvdC family ATP-grasp ribosomal peptide maturase [bacterium]